MPLAVQEEFLYSMEDRSEGLLQVKVYEGEETIYEWQDTLELLGPEEWSGLLMMPELAAVYVTPYHPCIVGLAARATGFLYQDWLFPIARLYTDVIPPLICAVLFVIIGKIIDRTDLKSKFFV